MLRHSMLVGVVMISTCFSPRVAQAGQQNPEADAGNAARRATQVEPVVSLNQFTDVRPSDWSYEALHALVERSGCVAGSPNGTFQGGQPLTRYEAAALLMSCLDHGTEVTDAVKRLIREFEGEMAVLKGHTDALEARVAELGATRFATTTKLGGRAIFVIGSNGFGGSARKEVNSARSLEGATTFNEDVELNIDTSFKGDDLLRMGLRAGNFAGSAFGNGGLNELEAAFQEDCGNNPDGSSVDCRDVVAVDKIFYQFPLGHQWVATLGGRVGQEDMVAVWPSVYPADSILNLFSFNGAPAAYNKNLGPGGGLWWKNGPWSFSANYVAAQGNQGNPGLGGMGTPKSQGSGSAQLAHATDNWAIAGIYSRLQEDTDVPGTTPLAAGDWRVTGPGQLHAFAISGYWQPSWPGWIPSISLGWGHNRYIYNQSVPKGSLRTSQSWSIGLQWDKAFRDGNALGFALGQPVFATGLSGGVTPNDGNYAFELWYKIQATDHISVTPAIFYLSRPEGQETPAGKAFTNFGALVKTTLKF